VQKNKDRRRTKAKERKMEEIKEGRTSFLLKKEKYINEKKKKKWLLEKTKQGGKRDAPC